MRPNLSVVTLGVRDLARSLRFYRDVLGWPTDAQAEDGIAFFRLRGVVLALFPKEALAEDATVGAEGSGFAGITLAHNARDRDEVDAIFRRLAAQGVRIPKLPQPTEWGGYGGYFSDPDGYLWEVVFNPNWPLDADGQVVLPE